MLGASGKGLFVLERDARMEWSSRWSPWKVSYGVILPPGGQVQGEYAEGRGEK